MSMTFTSCHCISNLLENMLWLFIPFSFHCSAVALRVLDMECVLVLSNCLFKLFK